MGQVDLTYSLESVSGTNLNVSEDGTYSLTIESDSIEYFNFTALVSGETTLIGLTKPQSDFKYVVIVNLDSTNSVRVRTTTLGGDTVDEECPAGRPLIIPSQLYLVGTNVSQAIEMILFEEINVQAIGADVSLKIFYIK